ncbi:hypothetical protein ARMSODRAFT_688080 [Armillaria solidipes]|uniref:Uncharacterized protein n=1 Tax=Armillaria solidipes TaxID=1076256 RepID=A0A2H3B7Z2_9AGAR|nr:hypothetical protein ARMSODRAFT_688080 [Armillaria solidipes]
METTSWVSIKGDSSSKSLTERCLTPTISVMGIGIGPDFSGYNVAIIHASSIWIQESISIPPSKSNLTPTQLTSWWSFIIPQGIIYHIPSAR